MWRLATIATLVGCGFEQQLAPGDDTMPGEAGTDAVTDAMTDTPPVDPSGFRWRRRLTWSGVPSDVANLVVPVLLDPTRIEYAMLKPDASDLAFFDAMTMQQLPHEIERWDPNGSSVVWIRIPLVDAAATRSVWMYYADPEATVVENPTAVWAGFAAVWHLDEAVTDNTTAGTHADASGNNHVGMQRNNASVTVTGGLAGVQELDGNGDFIEIPQAGFALTNAVTIEARVVQQTASSSYPHVLTMGADGRTWQIFWDKDTGDAGWAGALSVAGADERIRTASGALNEWRSLALVYNGSAVTLYMDGVSIGTSPASGTLDPFTSPLYLGSNPILGGLRDLDGYIDEVRISGVARTAPWLVASHRAMTNQLLAFGAPEMP